MDLADGMERHVDLADAVETLYALPPEEFVARRGELVAAARVAKDRSLASATAALRKPSVSAWALNQLARRHPAEVAGLMALGDRLREAQAAGDGAALRDLGRERTALVGRLTALATRDAAALGVALSASGEAEVADTLTAALASPEAAEAVTGGTLTRSLRYAGFGDVDLSAATAPAVPGRPRLLHSSKQESSDDGGAERLLAEERRRALAAAEATERAATRAASVAAEYERAAAQAEQEAQAEVEALQQRLDEARQRLADATSTHRATSRAEGEADGVARRARAEVARLRSAADS